MISKHYLYYLVWDEDSSLETPTLESVLVVCEFSEDLLGVPPESEINFGIDLLADT